MRQAIAAFFSGPIKRIWDSPRAGVPLWIACAGLAVYWSFRLPPAGYAIGALAVVAGVMSVREMKVIGKITWVALLIVFLLIEFHAIGKDRIEQQNAQNTFERNENERADQTLVTERDNTKQLIEQENQSFEQVLSSDQKQFTQSLSAILATHKEDEADFSRVVKREESLIQSQQDLSEQFVGRLVPGNEPTPPNPCMRLPVPPQLQKSGAITTIIGDNAILGPSRRHAILQVGDTWVLGLAKVPDSDAVSLSVDFRDDRNRVLLRMDENGVVNRSLLILQRPVKNEFLIEDAYGKEFMKVIYLNPTTFRVMGSGMYCGKVIPVLLPFGSDDCMTSLGDSAGVEITLPACQSR
jgi:hypothetical protein